MANARTRCGFKAKTPSKLEPPPKRKQAPAFPSPDPIRPAFCCSSIVPTSHSANVIPHPYSIQILAFTTHMKQMGNIMAIPVKDYTWKGLQSAEFILELKRDMIVKQECVTRSRNVKEESKVRIGQGGAWEGSKSEDITSGGGRYFVKSEEEAGGFVEVLINDGKVPWGFENVLGICKEFICAEKQHGAVVFRIEVWEGTAALGKYYGHR